LEQGILNTPAWSERAEIFFYACKGARIRGGDRERGREREKEGGRERVRKRERERERERDVEHGYWI
jgi:hypothetical protein